MVPGPKYRLERCVCQFYTICDKNLLLKIKIERVTVILVLRSTAGQLRCADIGLCGNVCMGLYGEISKKPAVTSYLLSTWAKRDFLVQIAGHLFLKLYGKSYEEFSGTWSWQVLGPRFKASLTNRTDKVYKLWHRVRGHI
jgi:hypothetical protein